MTLAARSRLLLLPLVLALCGSAQAFEVIEVGIEPLRSEPAASAPAVAASSRGSGREAAAGGRGVDEGFIPGAVTLVLAALGSALYVAARRPAAG